ncbi:metallophosphoesterase family protein [candidate division WWE3 bacterium]|nr:metallophosphoesterase family protein [candidate division WWE3 bacterium]
MIVAILSDIHDHIWNLEKILAMIKTEVDAVIYCGDFCAPFSAEILGRVERPIYACLGNNDEDQIGIHSKLGSNATWFNLSQEYGTAELDNRTVAFCHYPRLAELLAKTGEYDAVFHGHNHIAKSEYVGSSLLLNPGAVCGIQFGKPGKASFAYYDTIKNSSQIVFLEDDK